MIKPKISIITVCYNAEDTIKKTLISIKSQTYTNIEYIIIDGKSNDNTLQLVYSIITNPIIKSEKDKGIYDAMNKAISLATGDYIWFINAGDKIAKENTIDDIIVKKIDDFKNINGVSPDIIYADTAIIDKKDNILGLRRLRPPKNLNIRSFKNGMLVCHQAFIVKRELVEYYDLSYKFSSDFDWCIRCLSKARTTLFIDKVIVHYLNEGTTTQNHKASLIERFKIMAKYYGLFTTIINHFKFFVVRNR